MATILNPILTISPKTPALGSPVNAKVTFKVKFSILEKLLAKNGLWFRCFVRFYEVDTPSSSLTNDDLLDVGVLDILSSEFSDSPHYKLYETSFDKTFNLRDLRGPDDDNSFYDERIRVQICIQPMPNNAIDVSSDCKLSNIEYLDTFEPGFELN